MGKSDIHVWSCSRGKCKKIGWVEWRFLGSKVSREPISQVDLVNVGKLQQEFLSNFYANVLWNGEWVVSGAVLCGCQSGVLKELEADLLHPLDLSFFCQTYFLG